MKQSLQVKLNPTTYNYYARYLSYTFLVRTITYQVISNLFEHEINVETRIMKHSYLINRINNSSLPTKIAKFEQKEVGIL